MSNISLSQALSFFELSNNYTEEDLKKKYRELMKENHPDYHMNASQEEYEQYNRKTQDINEAYEVLKRNLNRSTNRTNQSNQGYNHRKTQTNTKLIFEREEAIKKINSYFKKCDAEKLMQQVNKLIIDYVTKIKKCSDINEIIIVQLCFKLDLEKLYQDYIILYSKKHNIPSFIIKNKNFNYNCDCSNLFSQIKDCERVVELDISKIIRKYQYHEHFKVLEQKILEERDKLKQIIYFSISQEEYLKLLNEYDNKINSIIVEYSIKYYKLKSALDKISPQLDSETRKYLYDNIKEIVLKLDGFEPSDILKDIQEEQISSKTIEEIYSELRKKYSANADSANIDVINELFIKAVELLYSKDCTIGLAIEISRITFSNPKEELEKLIKLSSNIDRTNDEFICIKVSKETPIPMHKIYKAKLTSSNGTNYYELKKLSIEDEVLNEKTFKKDYIHIDNFLSDAIFLGYKSNLEPYIQILYFDPTTKKVIIRFLKDGMFATTEYTFILQISVTRDKATDVYQNKAYLKEKMSKHFDQEYEKKKNHNKNKRR